MIHIKNEEEVELMRNAGKILAVILKELQKKVSAGMTTLQLDKLAHELVLLYAKKEPDAQIEPGFLGYQPYGNDSPYPATLCTSINDEIVHSVPSERKLKEGDILSIDFGVKYKGYNADAAVTFPIGSIPKEVQALLSATNEALHKGIKMVKPGRTLGDVGNAIQSCAESKGYGVVRDLVGHGIGKKLHEEPHVPNYGTPGQGVVLEEGMVIAIEPMLTMGTHLVSQDGFIWKTADGSLSAHFEHTVAVTKRGHEILTK